MEPYAYFKKQFMPISEVRLSPMTHALHYGSACFEGIRGNWNAEEKQIYLFRAKEHFERLAKSCRVIKIDLPYTIEEMCQLSLELVRRGGYEEDVYVRPLAYKSAEAFGVRLHDVADDFMILLIPWGPYLDAESGIRCGTSSWTRIADNMIPPRAKICGLYVNSALAKSEAIENGFDEAIMLTPEGHVSEGSGENIFLVLDGKLVTPPCSDSILMGITRDTVIQLAKNELGIETVERSIDRCELYMADECFMTGTAAHVAPVIEIDHRKVGDGCIGPLTSQLQKLYADVECGRNKKYLYWCTPCYVGVKG